MPAVGAISALLWFIPKYFLIVILNTLHLASKYIAEQSVCCVIYSL